jgi:hypothetical protein
MNGHPQQSDYLCLIQNNHLNDDERNMLHSNSKKDSSLANSRNPQKLSHKSPLTKQATGPDPSFSLTTFDFQLTNKQSNSAMSNLESEEKFYGMDHFGASEVNINGEHSFIPKKGDSDVET